MYAGREEVNPQAGRDCAADVYRQAGITDPRKQPRLRRGLRAVQLVRADVAGEPGFRRGGRGLEDDHVGRHLLDEGGDIPGTAPAVLSSNPIGASGMIRFAEGARQVRGDAGAHQVEGANSPWATPTAAAPSFRHVGRGRRKP